MSGRMGAPLLRAERDYWVRERARRAAFLVDAEAYFAAFRDACLRAESVIRIIGWDIHSRTRLVPDEPEDGLPAELGPFFDALLRRRRGLRIDILIWDFAMIYSIEREGLPLLNRQWSRHRRLRLRFAADHPIGAAHHQKIAIIDDCLAFVGGIDLTMRRWDTSSHRPDDPRRVDPYGEPYPPFHDIHMAVEGEIVASLSQLARERWRRAAGDPVPPVRDAGERWPRTLAPDLEHIPVAVARTEPDHGGRAEVREVQNLWLNAIAAARHSLYIETQYLTAAKIADAIVARLAEPACPEIVIVLPRECHGWLEQTALADCQARIIGRLRASDPHGRLRCYYPVAAGADADSEDEHWIRVHSKALVVDDRLLRIGSSNLSNRSMGVDTECDLAIEAEDESTRRAIALFRDRLLGEHLGRAPEEIAASVAAHGIIGAIKRLGGAGGYQLREVRAELPDDPAEFAMIEAECLRQSNPFDPERPIRPESFLDDFLPEMPGRKRLVLSLAGSILAALAFAGLVAAWHFTPLAQLFTLEGLVAEADHLQGSPLLPLFVVATFVVGGFALVPVMLLIAASGVAFGPLLGFLYAAAGAFASAAVGFFAGRIVGRETVRRLAGNRLNRISRRLAAHGLVTVTVLRLLPVAPYVLVNLVAGAMQVRFRDFIAGTVLGMTPGIIVMTLVGVSAGEVMHRPEPLRILVFVAALLTLALVGYALQRWLGLGEPAAPRRP
jgi:phospholipase D1/2